MSVPSGEGHPSARRRAILAGLIAGISAGYVSYLFTGIVGLIVGFVAGMIVGSRTVLLMAREREKAE